MPPHLMAVVARGDFDVVGIEQLIIDHFSALRERVDPRPRTSFPVSDHDETLTTIAPDPEATELGVSIYVKRSQRRSHETRLEQNGFWMYQLLYADRYDTDPRDILKYNELIERLSCESLRDAAGRYPDTDNCVRVSLYPDQGI